MHDEQSLHKAVADPERNLGGGGSRGPKGRVGRVREGFPLPLVGVRGTSPEKFLKKNDAKWCNLECK